MELVGSPIFTTMVSSISIAAIGEQYIFHLSLLCKSLYRQALLYVGTLTSTYIFRQTDRNDAMPTTLGYYYFDANAGARVTVVTVESTYYPGPPSLKSQPAWRVPFLKTRAARTTAYSPIKVTSSGIASKTCTSRLPKSHAVDLVGNGRARHRGRSPCGEVVLRLSRRPYPRPLKRLAIYLVFSRDSPRGTAGDERC